MRIGVRLLLALLLGPLLAVAFGAGLTEPVDAAVRADESGAPTSTVAPLTDADIPLLTEAAALKRTENFVDVIDVSGYLDPVMRDFIEDSIEAAVKNKSQALIIQLNSPGSLLPQADLDALETRIRTETRVPIAVWVGGLDARAKGGAARIVSAADVVGVAGSTKIGDSTRPAPGAPQDDPLVGRVFTYEQALKSGVAAVNAPVLVELVGQLHGRTIDGKKIETIYRTSAKGESAVRKPFGVRFAKLGLLQRLLHLATTPQIAYLFLLIALALFVFEFFTGGIGVAAVVGLMAFVLAASGLGNLPTRPLGLILLLVAMLGFAIDIQAGTPRAWTVIGIVTLVAGSFTLFTDGVRVPIFWIGLLTVLIVLFMVNGMPTMVRTRFATPTIGREAMVGEIGAAREAVAPEGTVVVRGAPWKARTNRATPIPAGAPVRVVSIDGLLLEVEPLEGAAKQHRG